MNPTLRLIDIPHIAHLAVLLISNPLLVVDCLSPYCSSALLLAADFVLHSVRKYINGHSDLDFSGMVALGI